MYCTRVSCRQLWSVKCLSQIKNIILAFLFLSKYDTVVYIRSINDNWNLGYGRVLKATCLTCEGMLGTTASAFKKTVQIKAAKRQHVKLLKISIWDLFHRQVGNLDLFNHLNIIQINTGCWSGLFSLIFCLCCAFTSRLLYMCKLLYMFLNVTK